MQIFYLRWNNFLGEGALKVSKSKFKQKVAQCKYILEAKSYNLPEKFFKLVKKPSLQLYFSIFFMKYVSDWWKVP